MTPTELEQKFWKHLDSDRTVFLACDGAQPRPMHAAFDDKKSPIWFFTSYDTDIGEALTKGARDATMTFASKGHDFWASATGLLSQETDKAVLDKLWNPFVAAWYEDGKDDPKLVLARYDVREAQLWEDGSSLVAGIQSLLGRDPKESFEDKTAHVRMAG